MTATFWWVLLLVFGIILGNLWLLRHNKAQDAKWREQQASREKSQEGATTSTALGAGSAVDVSHSKHSDLSSSTDASDGGGD